MKEIDWKLPKYKRNQFTKQLKQLNKRLEEEKEAAQRAKNLLAWHEYNTEQIEKKIKYLVDLKG